MSTPNLTPSERDRQNLMAFLDPILKGSGLTLRPFGINAMNRMQFIGLSFFSEEFARVSPKEQLEQVTCLLVLQVAPIDDVKAWARKYEGRWREFYKEVCLDFFPEDADFGAMDAISEQIQQTAPAVGAAQVELVESAALAGSGERPPPNS
jgi:hypothetical protein